MLVNLCFFLVTICTATSPPPPPSPHPPLYPSHTYVDLGCWKDSALHAFNKNITQNKQKNKGFDIDSCGAIALKNKANIFALGNRGMCLYGVTNPAKYQKRNSIRNACPQHAPVGLIHAYMVVPSSSSLSLSSSSTIFVEYSNFCNYGCDARSSSNNCCEDLNQNTCSCDNSCWTACDLPPYGWSGVCTQSNVCS